MIKLTVLLTITVALVSGCAEPKKPRLYPNQHLEQVGQGAAQQDINNCYAKAKASDVNETRDGQIGEKAAKGAVLGGVSAGAWDLIRKGKITDRTLAGAVAGAATGATIGAFDSRKTDSVFINYVNTCLSEKGYKVIGWQ